VFYLFLQDFRQVSEIYHLITSRRPSRVQF
jgi:hypothetical protein